MVLTYRKAAESDATLLIDIYNASFYEDYIHYGECPGYGKTKEQMESSVRAFSKYIVSKDGIPVGVISFETKGNGSYHIGCLCVIPAYQRQGIGSQAFRYMLSACPDWKHIAVTTPSDKEKNLKFYTEKCGFSIAGKEMDGTVEVATLVMERHIPAEGELHCEKNRTVRRKPMREHIPSESALTELLGHALFAVWKKLCAAIDEAYEMERQWNAGGKNWTYEYKYRRGGKTLCSLYAKEKCVGFMIVFGKDERAKCEDIRGALSASVCRQYDEAKTYHDGKWVMFTPTGTAEFDDYMKLLAVKRKPDKKKK